MEIGFIKFDEEALRRSRKVIKLLGGQGTIDELGLGRVRDAFSNTLFPGISLLHTRAKYFLLLPALYEYLTSKEITGPRAARQLVRDYEIRLTRRLKRGSLRGPDGKDPFGIIGSDFVADDPKDKSFVKYDPAYVYNVGLQTYGLIPSGGNIYQILAETSRRRAQAPQRNISQSDDIADDTGALSAERIRFGLCCRDYRFEDDDSPLDIRLDGEEAQFLSREIQTHSDGSLLKYLIERDGDIGDKYGQTFDSLEPILSRDIPDTPLLKAYILALRFSRFALLLRTRYAILLNEASGAVSASAERADSDSLYRQYDELLSKHAKDFAPDKIEEIIKFASGHKANPIYYESFLREAAKYIFSGDMAALDEAIARREIEVKSKRRSKLANPAGEKYFTPAEMNFRWPTVFTILGDLREGKGSFRS